MDNKPKLLIIPENTIRVLWEYSSSALELTWITDCVDEDDPEVNITLLSITLLPRDVSGEKSSFLKTRSPSIRFFNFPGMYRDIEGEEDKDKLLVSTAMYWEENDLSCDISADQLSMPCDTSKKGLLFSTAMDWEASI